MTDDVFVPLARAHAASASVTLIRPPTVVFPKSLSGHGPTPPIGLAYIAAVLRDGGHHVTAIDGTGADVESAHDFEVPLGTLTRVGLSPEEVVERIPAETDIVGISAMFVHEWPQVREIAELARKRFPEAAIVVGGETATSSWAHMFAQTDAIDYAVLGEGEGTTLQLVDLLAAGQPVNDLPGLAIRHPDKEPTGGGLPVRMRKLDAVPRPAWDLFPIEKYLSHADYFGVNRGRSMPVLATRGCPYKCSFCSSPQMWTTRYVVREPEDVVDEIAEYVERYGIRNVDFCDLTAITKRKWTLRFCDALEARGLDITWQLPVGTRAEALDEEVLRRLYETGCRNVTYAPESGSVRMLEIFDKKVKLPHILESLRAAHRLGLATHVNVIIGHPDERWSDLGQTAWFLIRTALAGCDTASPIMFCAYPGSADYERLVAEGRAGFDDDNYYVGISRGSGAHQSYNPRISTRQLRLVQLAMVAVFHGFGLLLHPSRVIRSVRAQRTGQESTHLDQLIRIKREGRRSRRDRSSDRPVAA